MTKTCVYLGRLDEGLEYGILLVQEITQENDFYYDILDNNLNDSFDLEKNKKLYWDVIHNMDAFTYNIMEIAKHLRKFDLGVKIGNIFLEHIKKHTKVIPDFVIKQFKNWRKTSEMRIAELTNLKNNQNNKGDNRPNTFIRLKELGGKDKKIDNILKCYLKCVYRGLTGINKGKKKVDVMEVEY